MKNSHSGGNGFVVFQFLVRGEFIESVLTEPKAAPVRRHHSGKTPLPPFARVVSMLGILTAPMQ